MKADAGLAGMKNQASATLDLMEHLIRLPVLSKRKGKLL